MIIAHQPHGLGLPRVCNYLDDFSIVLGHLLLTSPAAAFPFQRLADRGRKGAPERGRPGLPVVPGGLHDRGGRRRRPLRRGAAEVPTRLITS